MKSRQSGRVTRNTMSSKGASRSNTPIKESSKLDKILKKNDNDKIQKQDIIEEVIEVESDNEKQQSKGRLSLKEEVNGNDKKSPQSPEKKEKSELKENGAKEKNGEREVQNEINGEEKVDNNLTESVQHDGTNGNNKSAQHCEVKTNGNSRKEDNEKENFDNIIDESKIKSDEIMEEPMLTLSEDDEKLSLNDSFEIESSSSSAPVSITPATKISPAESQLVNSNNHVGTITNECILVEESDDTTTDTESSTPLEQKVSSTEMVQEVNNISIQNQSLIANYSGSTIHDLSVEPNNSNASNMSDSLNITTESPNITRSTRSILCRRSLRPLREVSFRNARRLGETSQSSTNVTVNTELSSSIGSKVNRSLKRERSKTPVDDNKKIKIDSQDEFIKSFVPSPMTALKRRFYTSKINSSTPIRTAEVNNSVCEATESQSTSGSIEGKKSWCVIM